MWVPDEYHIDGWYTQSGAEGQRSDGKAMADMAVVRSKSDLSAFRRPKLDSTNFCLAIFVLVVSILYCELS